MPEGGGVCETERERLRERQRERGRKREVRGGCRFPIWKDPFEESKQL